MSIGDAKAPALALALAAGAIGCAQRDEDQRAPAAADTVLASGAEALTIDANTQATLDDVRIAVGNIWEEPYVDESGASRNGLTAMLKTFVRNDAAQNITTRVHPGQKLVTGHKGIEVESIDERGVRLVVRSESGER